MDNEEHRDFTRMDWLMIAAIVLYAVAITVALWWLTTDY